MIVVADLAAGIKPYEEMNQKELYDEFNRLNQLRFSRTANQEEVTKRAREVRNLLLPGSGETL